MGIFGQIWNDKKSHVVLFSSTAIALYGYDQGMMSLINTNHNYLATMGIAEDNPLVGVIVAVYYLGCSAGAVVASWYSDRFGRRKSIFLSLVTASLGNLIMFIAGLGNQKSPMAAMFIGRIVMGLGVGGIDCVVPTFSSELTSDDARGKALAQEFQANILGLNLAFAINLACTYTLGKYNEWAWRIPIICMQAFSASLLLIVDRLPESPRYLMFHDRRDDAANALKQVFPDEDEFKPKLDALTDAAEKEGDDSISYMDMFTPSHLQFHPTMITVMGQVNQALTGYGAVSVYGPQIFELLGFAVSTSEFLTQANYISYLILMTGAWLLIDAVGRRYLMVVNSIGLTVCFLLLTLLGGLAFHCTDLNIACLGPAIPGVIALFVATGNFGIGWLATVWLIPTEIYPTVARAKGTAVSVVVWGLANFAITLLTPILFNNLVFWLYLIFGATNLFAGAWTYFYLPESGGRTFEENQQFFKDAKEQGTWRVHKVIQGRYTYMPYPQDEYGERTPLLRRVRQQAIPSD